MLAYRPKSKPKNKLKNKPKPMLRPKPKHELKPKPESSLSSSIGLGLGFKTNPKSKSYIMSFITHANKHPEEQRAEARKKTQKYFLRHAPKLGRQSPN